MNISDLSISRKIGLLVLLMGIAAATIATVGSHGLSSLGAALQDTGAREEVAREAMDLRIDVIAISRMTYQLALAPEKASDFAAETDKRAKEMLDRLPKIASTADANEQKLLDGIRTSLTPYFDQIRAMVAVARSAQGQDRTAIVAELDKALEGQKAVTAAIKEYSTYSAETLSGSRGLAISRSTTTQTVLLATTFVCIVAGMLMSVLVARHGIVRPIQRLTGAMSSLATGKLDEEIPCTDRKDEIGAMARTLAIFRDNEKQMREMEAQEAALQAQSRDLQSNISTIVAAAAAGDFSRRITKSYDDADLRRFAASVNELLENVDRGVSEVRRVIASLSEADLTQEMRGHFQGDFAELQANVNGAMLTLRSTMTGILATAGAITGNSRELSTAADQLARRTEQQAASLEETAAALEEITTTVKTSTSRALEASEIVREAKDSADKSGGIVQNAIDAMGRIEQSSQKISQIISVIDEIAFQTNLLALNAGVEAARAGEAGRGFAVVAQEVRELAQRSANAAKEIKTLINASAGEVKGGVSLVLSTGDVLSEIKDLVNRVNDHVVSITRAAQEQSAALGEINTAVNQMDQMTQQNAAMVEETTAASQILATEATQLQTSLSQFHIGEERSGRVQQHRAAA
ncbi:methyl-accepting chemotaxis protein [Rhizobiaceae bacterium n13]|uniref:Methyl-accepting chemotaxis protein n=1 Tax=Ferirhizobium litorale TaxID=2927786 RepID=A0AAE3QGZ4_9HYPH|nr:methyl-accepting chemotaxis protein [Fererhizobium litorale]MDI7863126.1 methyl-accepting chemotaxis protein [Fererhizobium litorale]MDI7923196.1 methyl-accepting chemotaxis protein [Fererhizobium litorale]